jgi:hypothetical protein
MTERPSGVVSDALQALQRNPLVVGMLLLNLLFFGGSIWYMTHSEDKRHEAIRLILDRCIPMVKT